MRYIVSQFRQLPLKEKSLVVLLALILVAIVSIWTSLWVKGRQNAVITAMQAEIETEREQSQKQQEQNKIEQNRLAIEKNTAISKAQAEELGRIKAELATRRVTGTLRVVTRQRTQEQWEYEQKIKDVLASTATACDRWLRNCAVAKRLGLRAATEPCDCARR